MSTLIATKENDVVVLGADSRWMSSDRRSVQSDSAPKLVQIRPDLAVAVTGMIATCKIQLAKAFELAPYFPNVADFARALYAACLPEFEVFARSLSRPDHISGEQPFTGFLLAGYGEGRQAEFVYVEVYCRNGQVECEGHTSLTMPQSFMLTAGEEISPEMAADKAAGRIFTGDPVAFVRRVLKRQRELRPLCGGPDQIVMLNRDGVQWVAEPPAFSLDSWPWPASEANSGHLDAGKILRDTIASHLDINSGVLGVKASGITAELIHEKAIQTIHLVDAAVGNNQIAPFAVTAAKIGAAAIQNAHLDRATANKIAIVDADIVNLAANKITAGTLAAGVVYAGTINANQVNAGAFNGCSLALNSNGITATINNGASGLGWNAGLTVSSNSDNSGAYVGAAHVMLLNGAGSDTVDLTPGASGSGGGSLALYSHLGSGYGSCVTLSGARSGSANVGYLSLAGAGGVEIGGAGSLSINGNYIVGSRVNGWTIPTGSLTRTGFNTGTVTLPELAARVAALINDLHASGYMTHGLLGS